MKWVSPGVGLSMLMALLAPMASAQVDPLRRPPIVFIILDSSGSMSYVQGKELITPTCSIDADVALGDDPALQRDPTVTYQYSRDMIAKEVLTGSYEDFWCRERQRPTGRFDADYPIPWITPEFSGQSNDGIMDVNRERAKFAFATFDTVLKADKDGLGGWSVGPNSQPLASIGKTNLGLQNETASWGRLSIPTAADETDQIVTFNNSVQDEILRAIPYGGTPISPALEDTTWLLQNHARLVKRSTSFPDGDPYKKCRPRNILLITDGRPNMGENQLGYKSSVQAAERLFKNGYKVYVVGFNLETGTTTLVHDIAEAGGTEEAHIAENPTQLGTALSEILGKATPGVSSRTDSVFTDATNSQLDLQYQINTAYGNANTSDIDLAGYFEVTAYRCEDGCRDAAGGAGACEVYDARDTLNKRTRARELYFVLDGKRSDFKKTNLDLTSNLLELPTTGTLSDLAPTLIDGQYRVSGEVLGTADDTVVREVFRGQLVDLIHSGPGTRRVKDRLGAIWHSTPVLQTSLDNIDVQIPSFTEYKKQIALRPTVAYTMTHDGFIHAFHLSKPGAETPTSVDWLDELWAIVPQAIVPRLQELGTKLQVLADGRMTLKDIRLERSDANATAADEVKQWKTMLVAPYRQGARGLIGLDVTDPYNPIVRWEITNKRRCWLDNPATNTTKCETFDQDDKSDFRNLGHVHAKPQIGTVFIEVGSAVDKREVAAAFFPCGEAVPGEPESGKCFMVVRLDTGEKLKEFRNGNDSIVDDNSATDNLMDTLDHPVVGDPVAYNTFLGTFVSRLFVGDGGGQMWRIDVAATDPEDWKMSFFFDVYDDLSDQPMFSAVRSALRAAPAISPVPSRGQLVLVFGTGDIDYAKEGQKTVIYSIKERLGFTASSGASTGVVTHELNWKRELALGETLTSRPLIFGRTAYFTSFESDKNDACEGGTGRIWGLDFLDNKLGDPIGTLDKDGDVATALKVEYVELEDTVPYGATVVSRPACIGNQGVEAASGSGSSSVGNGSGIRGATSGELELIVQTGTTGKGNALAEAAKGSKTASVNKYSQKLVRPPKQVISVSWGEVQNL